MHRSIHARSFFRPRRLVAAVVAALVLAASTHPAEAVFTLTLQRVGTSVTVTGNGSLDTTGLNTADGDGNYGGGIRPGDAFLFSGTGTYTLYKLLSATGPTSFGANTNFAPTTSTGDPVGIQGNGAFLSIPVGYASGSALADFSTYAGQTFATLGFLPGTYSYSLPSGDTLVVTGVVPEPSTWVLLGLGAAGLGLTLRHRHVRAA